MLEKTWRIASVIWKTPALFLALLLFAAPGQVYGTPDILDLQMDDPALVRWDVADIKPGDSGIEPVNLYNVGDIPGYVYIWIGEIIDGEGLNPESETGNTLEPGELSSFINLNIINPGMTFGKLTGTGYMQHFNLPVSIASFPSSSDQALFLLDTVINPGETLELQWQWELPANSGNQVQGDTVSFTFYYMLSTFYTEEEEEEEPEPTEPPVYFPPPTVPSSVPPATPITTPPTVEPPVHPEVHEPEDVTATDNTDISYVVLIGPETTTPAAIETGETSNLRELLAQASLGVAVAGTVAMTTLAVIQRIRRYRLIRTGE